MRTCKAKLKGDSKAGYCSFSLREIYLTQIKYDKILYFQIKCETLKKYPLRIIGYY